MKGHSRRNKSQSNNSEEFTIDEFRTLVREELETKVRKFSIEFISEILQEEVTELCGQMGKHKFKDNLAHRGGSEKGWIILDRQRTKIIKPRVRKDGKEVQLEKYKALQSIDNLGDIIRKYMVHGISVRSYDEILEKFAEDLGLSKSSVSRQFTKKSRESLNYLNTRTFEDHKFWCLMVDGIEFGDSILIVALGVNKSGEKHILGLSEGSTENSEVVKSLLEKITAENRNINFTERILAVIDGSKALRKGLNSIFSGRVDFHRCVIHKERNILSKLNRQYHSEFKRRYHLAVNSVSFEDAKQEMDNLEAWLLERNLEAGKSLAEADGELLTLHQIGMPANLRKSFLSTNLIESAFSHPRKIMSRVKRWHNRTDQLQRWAAVTFLEQEKKFRKVKNYKEVESFVELYLTTDEKNIGQEKLMA